MQRAAFLPFLALLAACQATLPPGLPEGDVTLLVAPRLAARQVLDVTPYAAADIDHLTITLEKAGVAVGSPLGLTKVADGPLDGHVVTFQHLHKDTVYTVKARAYLADNTPISDDASSQTTVSTVGPQPGVSFEDHPTISAGLPVRLVDRTFDGSAKNTALGAGLGLVVGDGGYTTTAGYAITIGTGVTQTILGNGLQGSATDPNPLLVQLAQATVVAFASDGTYYLGETGNTRVQRVDGSTNQVSLLDGAVQQPTGLAVGSDGLVYIADAANNTIKAEDPSNGNVIKTFGTLGLAGYLDGLLPLFDTPGDLVAIGAKIYVADVGNHRIRAIDTTTGVVSTLVGDGSGGQVDSDDPQIPVPTVSAPKGMAKDADGNLVFVDGGPDRLRRYDFTSGKLRTLTGQNGSANGYQDGDGPDALFDGATGLAPRGSLLYVADTNNQRIRQVDLAASPIKVTTLAGSGVAGYREGAYRGARFYNPRGLAVLGSTLYVVDAGNNRLRKL